MNYAATESAFTQFLAETVKPQEAEESIQAFGVYENPNEPLNLLRFLHCCLKGINYRDAVRLCSPYMANIYSHEPFHSICSADRVNISQTDT